MSLSVLNCYHQAAKPERCLSQLLILQGCQRQNVSCEVTVTLKGGQVKALRLLGLFGISEYE